MFDSCVYRVTAHTDLLFDAACSLVWCDALYVTVSEQYICLNMVWPFAGPVCRFVTLAEYLVCVFVSADHVFVSANHVFCIALVCAA
jgi:hypothetical protein